MSASADAQQLWRTLPRSEVTEKVASMIFDNLNVVRIPCCLRQCEYRDAREGKLDSPHVESYFHGNGASTMVFHSIGFRRRQRRVLTPMKGLKRLNKSQF